MVILALLLPLIVWAAVVATVRLLPSVLVMVYKLLLPTAVGNVTVIPLDAR
jgi:hypothetical protein